MIELDWITVLGFVLLAALITLAIWAPGPLRDHRGKLAAGIVAVLGFVLGRSTKKGPTGAEELTDDDDTPREGVDYPTRNKLLEDALAASDELLDQAENDANDPSPYSDLSDDALRRALESATGTGADE